MVLSVGLLIILFPPVRVSDLRKDREQETEGEEEREKQSGKRKRGVVRGNRISRQLPSFHNLSLEVTYCHFCYTLLVTQTKPGTVWEGTTEKCSLGISRGQFRGYLPNWFTVVLCM